MTIDQIRFFIAVAEHRSFSDAADHLNVAQSSISKGIIALEGELNLVLFDRTKKVVVLTEAGKTLHPTAILLSNTCQSLIQQARQLNGKYMDRIHIVSYPILSQYGLFDLFQAFEERYPNIHIAVEEPHDLDVVRMLNRNACDFAIVRDTHIAAPEYEGIQLCNDELALFTHADSGFAPQKSVAVPELSREKLLLMKEGLPLHYIALKACLDAGFEPRVAYTARIETLLGLVRKGIGSALLARTITNIYQMKSIACVPVSPAIPCNVVLAWKKNRPFTAAMQIFCDYLTSHIY